jgi:ATP-dependent DNA ligase
MEFLAGQYTMWLDFLDRENKDFSPKFTSLELYRYKGGLLETTFYTIEGLLLTRVVGDKSYVSKVTGTKTLSAEQRRYTVMANKQEKLVRDGWCEDKGEAETVTKETLSKPMLFKKYLDHPDKITYPCICQVKYDGVRAIWDSAAGVLRSRGGNIYDLPHITKVLKEGVYCDLDGEVCFETIESLPDVVHGLSVNDLKLVFWIFDSLAEPAAPYRERLGAVMSRAERFKGTPLKIAHTRICSNRHEVTLYWRSMVELGHEGIMVKNMSVPYAYGKRTADHLKYKQEFENEFTVVAITQDERPEGNLISFNCITEDGEQLFKVTPAWTHGERRALYSHPSKFTLVGQKILIEYRAVSEDGIPIHAVGKTSFGSCLEMLRP